MADLPSPSYMEFFGDDYLGAYWETISPENAVVESAFVHRVLQLRSDAEVLDLCCGHGRHAVILALTGLRVTGLDLSEAYLERAEAIAASAGVDLPLVRSDMRELPFEGRFDAVINIFTSFGYLNSDEEDQKVLHQVVEGAEARRAVPHRPDKPRVGGLQLRAGRAQGGPQRHGVRGAA